MTMRTRIKICGVMNVATAQIAVAAGADAIGMIFHAPSKRHLQVAQASAIARTVSPFVATVAVMVNPSAEAVREIVATVNPSHLQFHGEESPEFCASFAKPYLKTMRISANTDTGADTNIDLSDALRTMQTRYHDAQGILLDSHVDDRYGGSGVRFDWTRLRDCAVGSLVLAGGLTIDNVHDALREVAPYAVDVSSGVESDGRKDAQKIRAFCDKVANYAA